jgi:hypothetical protein
VRRKHALGDKLFFYDVVQGNAQVQVLVNATSYKPREGQLSFAQVNEALRRGDIIGVIGHPGTSNTGELSVLAVTCLVASFATFFSKNVIRMKLFFCLHVCMCSQREMVSRIRNFAIAIVGWI